MNLHIFMEDMINSSAEIQSHCLSSSFVRRTKHRLLCEELFSKKYFDWTGTTTLGSYCVSATSSHYDWAIKDIKKALKKRREM